MHEYSRPNQLPDWPGLIVGSFDRRSYHLMVPLGYLFVLVKGIASHDVRLIYLWGKTIKKILMYSNCTVDAGSF